MLIAGLIAGLRRDPSDEQGGRVSHIEPFPHMGQDESWGADEVTAPWQFDRLYGAWFDRVIPQDAHAAVQRSADRYIRALSEITEERG